MPLLSRVLRLPGVDEVDSKLASMCPGDAATGKKTVLSPGKIATFTLKNGSTWSFHHETYGSSDLVQNLDFFVHVDSRKIGSKAMKEWMFPWICRFSAGVI